jgi:hypothetical protein
MSDKDFMLSVVKVKLGDKVNMSDDMMERLKGQINFNPVQIVKIVYVLQDKEGGKVELEDIHKDYKDMFMDHVSFVSSDEDYDED